MNGGMSICASSNCIGILTTNVLDDVEFLYSVGRIGALVIAICNNKHSEWVFSVAIASK